MWTKGFLPIICLLSLVAELMLGSSTGFVRVNPTTEVGRLALIETAIEKSADASHATDVLKTSQTKQKDEAPGKKSDGSSDLIKFAAAATHAAQISQPIDLRVIPPVSRLIPESDAHYPEPRPFRFQEPPSAG